jgi:hypothetical protein
MDLQHQVQRLLLSFCRVSKIVNIKTKQPYEITNEENKMKEER